MYSSGRGGAGNFKDPKEENVSKKLEDFERNPNVTAQRRQALESEVRDEDEKEAVSTRTEQPYVQSGRGGAGNIHEPSTLRDHEMSSKAEAASKKASLPAKSMSSQPVKVGRGGAGNYVESTSPEEDAEETKRREDLTKRVAEDVEKGLQKPSEAHLSPTKDSS